MFIHVEFNFWFRMDRIIEKYIRKKYRKRGDNYKLSEGSKVAAQEFSLSSKMAAQIYRAWKEILPKPVEASHYQKLVSLLRRIRDNNKKLLAEGADGFSYANMLLGLSLNERASWTTLLPWTPDIAFKQTEIIVELPSDKRWSLARIPYRVTRIAVTFDVLTVEFGKGEEPLHRMKTKTLFIIPNSEQKSERTSIPISLFPNSLIIVLGTVQFYLSENGGTLDFSSLHNQHVATDIMQVFHVKEGIVLKNKEQGKYVPPTPPERDGTDWEF
ncbi:hypothetical protein BC792_10921 [Sphingobacterium allocomposti]|uniref:Uncharacterized protein n=2 Tax=Sphingobacterium allocomposti TaxID=415956 RepID=A0A5S5DJG5_9SPHI|nr:hypothetical protein BC792_10921 [Sphingobacterium composti Yoo et al. 2007 non Ten et al. 2007]